MNEVPMKLGPLALLLTVISICMTTLAILTFTTARADQSLAEKYAETVKERYELEAQGQAYLAETSDDLSQGMIFLTDADGIIWNTLEQDNARLRIGVKDTGRGTYLVNTWQIERQWEEDTSIGNLWPGFGF